MSWPFHKQALQLGKRLRRVITKKWFVLRQMKKLVSIATDFVEDAHFQKVDIIVGIIGLGTTARLVVATTTPKLGGAMRPVEPKLVRLVSKNHLPGTLQVQPSSGSTHLPFEIATHIPLHLPIRPSVRERSELKYVCIGVVAVTRSTAVAYDERVEPKQSGRLWAAEVAAVSLRFGIPVRVAISACLNIMKEGRAGLWLGPNIARHIPTRAFARLILLASLNRPHSMEQRIGRGKQRIAGP
mmetsp:Transcript_3579/g.9070  ORF Transcript_3579/g.9070 Transcript_3579/m.9070 type:complete len:241 (-) Transcript_3579:540-1262(-)